MNNQPLTAILNNAEAVQTMLQADSPDLEEIKAAIADIIQDDTRAGETIRRLRSGSPPLSLMKKWT